MKVNQNFGGLWLELLLLDAEDRWTAVINRHCMMHQKPLSDPGDAGMLEEDYILWLMGLPRFSKKDPKKDHSYPQTKRKHWKFFKCQNQIPERWFQMFQMFHSDHL